MYFIILLLVQVLNDHVICTFILLSVLSKNRMLAKNFNFPFDIWSTYITLYQPYNSELCLYVLLIVCICLNDYLLNQRWWFSLHLLLELFNVQNMMRSVTLVAGTHWSMSMENKKMQLSPKEGAPKISNMNSILLLLPNMARFYQPAMQLNGL